MADIAKRALSRGEIDPQAHARTDWIGFQQGLSKARNVLVHKLGGVSNRAGTYFRAPVRYHDKATRLLPFKFGEEDTHFIELGDLYARFTRNGEHIFDITRTVTGVTNADPAEVTTSASHGFSTGDEVEISGVVGMRELNGRRFIVTSTGASTFTLVDQATGVAIDSSAFVTYVSGGTVSRVYTIASPYAEADLFKIKYKQSFDVVALTCEGYARRELQRAGLTSWSFVDIPYAPDHQPPTAPLVTPNTSGTETYRYAVTAVSAETGEESLAALSSTSFNITAVTKANPAVITLSVAPGYETGHEIGIALVGGMTELNGKRFRVAKLTTTTYELQSTDSTNFTTYTSGGTARAAFAQTTTGYNTPDNTVSWVQVGGTIEYNVYREKNGVFGYLGSSSGTVYVDDNSLAPDLSDTVPYYRNPFLGSGNEPLAIGRYQQRNVYAGTSNSPSKIEFSRIGARNNLSSSSPIRPDDAFSITLDGDELNKIRHVLTGRDLMVFTNTALHVIDSTSDSGFGFSSVRQRQQADVGSSEVPPLTIDKWVLFDEDQGVKVNSVQYRFSIDGYAPEDVSYFANHFFENDRIVEWAYASWPEPIVYAVTQSGYCLAFTYAPQEDLQIKAWTRFETSGYYRSVAAIREFPNDRRLSLGFIVERDGRQYVEVQNDRNFIEVEDCYMVDCGRTFEDAKALQSVAGDVYTIASHGWSDGDQVTVPGGLYYTVSNATTDTFELVDSDSTLYAAGAIFRKRQRNLDGLYHLAGKTIVALLDGNVERNITVDANGLLTLPYFSARTHIGLGYTSTVHSLPPFAARSEFGGKLIKMSLVKIDVKDSRGFHIGVVGGRMSPWKQREFEKIGQPTQLYTGFVEKTVDSTWDREGRLAIEQRDPLPLTIRAFIPDFIT